MKNSPRINVLSELVNWHHHDRNDDCWDWFEPSLVNYSSESVVLSTNAHGVYTMYVRKYKFSLPRFISHPEIRSLQQRLKDWTVLYLELILYHFGSAIARLDIVLGTKRISIPFAVLLDPPFHRIDPSHMDIDPVILEMIKKIVFVSRKNCIAPTACS